MKSNFLKNRNLWISLKKNPVFSPHLEMFFIELFCKILKNSFNKAVSPKATQEFLVNSKQVNMCDDLMGAGRKVMCKNSIWNNE